MVEPSNTSFGNTSLSSGDIRAINVIYPNRPNSRLMLPLLTDIFKNNENWTTESYSGTSGTFFADVTGDGKADTILVQETGVQVYRSNGTGFSAAEIWTTNEYFGSVGTYFVDVTGNDKADAIVVNDWGFTVRRSTGTAFSPNETWTSNPYLGSKGSFLPM